LRRGLHKKISKKLLPKETRIIAFDGGYGASNNDPAQGLHILKFGAGNIGGEDYCPRR